MLARFAYSRAHSVARHARLQSTRRRASGLAHFRQLLVLTGTKSDKHTGQHYISPVGGTSKLTACILGKRTFSHSAAFANRKARPTDDDFDPFADDGADSPEDMAAMQELMKESMGSAGRRMKEALRGLEDNMDKKPEDDFNPYKDVNEEVDPFEEDPYEPAPYKTVYLPSRQIDDMIKSGFLKNVHEVDPLENEPMPEAVDTLPIQERMFLRKFFMRLQYAKAHPMATTNRAAWKLFVYLYSKPHLAQLLNDSAWNLVWDLDNAVIPTIKKVIIGDLMVFVQAEMTEKQWISYIEALFWHGRREEALGYWDLGLKPKASLAWYATGARLLATDNLPEEAEKIIQKAMNVTGRGNAKLFIPTIVCYHALAASSKMNQLAKKDERYNQKALRLYNQMVRISRRIQRKEYLRVALSFLDAGYFSDAIMVYENMLNVYPNLIDESATSAYWDIKFKEAAIKAQNQAVDESDLRDLTLSALKRLPQKEKSVIILGNWMRNLIRMNRIEHALRIAREIQVLGFRTDTPTYNLLLILFDEHGKVGIMEYLASKMIRRLMEPMIAYDATFEQVLHDEEFQQQSEPEDKALTTQPMSETKTIQSTPRSAVQLPADVEELLARFEQKPGLQLPLVGEMRPKPLTYLSHEIFADIVRHDSFIPPADPATFGLLLNRCIKSFNVSKAISVLQLLDHAKVPLNSHIVNPLFQMLSRKKAFVKLFKAYDNLLSRDTSNVKVTGRTYEILFSALYKGNKDISQQKDLPSPRDLFTWMVQRSESVKITPKLYNAVLRCFWGVEDTVGAYTAMHGMSLLWDAMPRQKAIEITVGGISKAIGRMSDPWERRHVYWYVRKRAQEKFGKRIPHRQPRFQNPQLKRLRRLTRRRMNLRKEILEGEGHVRRKVVELQKINLRLRYTWNALKIKEERFKSYMESVPQGLKLPKTPEAVAVMTGAVPIDLDKGEDDHEFEDDTMQNISDFMKDVLFEGVWPKEWLEEAILLKKNLGLDDEEEISARKMNSLFELENLNI